MPRPRARSRNRPDAWRAHRRRAGGGRRRSLLGDAGRRELVDAGEADVGCDRGSGCRRNRLYAGWRSCCASRSAGSGSACSTGSGFERPAACPSRHRPAAADAGAVLPGADPAARRRPRSVPAARRTSSYRPEQIDVRLDDVDRDRRRQGGRRPLAQPVPRAQDLRRRDGRHAAARPAVRGRAGHRQDLPGQGDGARGRRAVPVRVGDVASSRCTTAPPPARSARTSRRCARPRAQEGGAIGFIEEIDAIAMRARRASPRRRLPAHALASGAIVLRRADRPAARRTRARPRRRSVRQPARSSARASAASSTSCSCRCSRSTSRPAGRSCTAWFVDARQPVPAAAPAAATADARRPRTSC